MRSRLPSESQPLHAIALTKHRLRGMFVLVVRIAEPRQATRKKKIVNGPMFTKTDKPVQDFCFLLS